MTVHHTSARSSAFTSVNEFLLLHRHARTRSVTARFFGVDPLARLGSSATYDGAVAEIVVADALDALGPDWTIVTDLALDDAAQPIAHVLIGPAGIFVLEVVNQANSEVWVGERSLVVDGAPGVLIMEAEQDADRLAARLSEENGVDVAVTPCLVIANAAELTVRARPRRVEILLPSAVGHFFGGLPRLLAPDVVERSRTAVLDQSTWSTGGGLQRPHAHAERAEFALIRRSVSASYRRRLGWVLGAATFASLLLVATTGGLVARIVGIVP